MPKLRNKDKRRKVLPAIHPNAGVTEWYADQLRVVLQEAVADAVMMLTAVLGAEPVPVGIIARDSIVRTFFSLPWDPVYVIAKDAPPKVTQVDKALKKWGDKWQRKFDKLSTDVSAKFAKRSFASTDIAMKAALRNAGFTVSFKPTRKSLEAYKLVVADNVGLIRNLQQNLYNKIQQDTWASVRAGGNMADLSAKLHQSYGIEANRAALIARDQNNKAKAVLESSRRQQLGLRKAIWQHSSAGKEPRPVHQAWGREGKMFDLDKGLYDTDEGQWVLPGTLINCRCSSRAIIPGLEDED